MTDKIIRAAALVAAAALVPQIFKAFVWAVCALSCTVHGLPMPTIAW